MVFTEEGEEAVRRIEQGGKARQGTATGTERGSRGKEYTETRDRSRAGKGSRNTGRSPDDHSAGLYHSPGDIFQFSAQGCQIPASPAACGAPGACHGSPQNELEEDPEPGYGCSHPDIRSPVHRSTDARTPRRPGPYHPAVQEQQPG